jgi:hypothetical protein
MAMFAAAFIAMRSVRLLPVFSSPAEEISAPTIIRFEPPPPKPIATPRPRPAVRAPAPPSVVAPATVPSAIAPPVTAAAPVGAPPADSSASAPTRRITDLLPVEPALKPPAAPTNVRGAPVATAGFTAPFRALSEAERDSIGAIQGARLAEALRRPPTKDELEAIRNNIEPGRAPRNTREGSDGKVVPLMNGGVSVGVPIWSMKTGFLGGKGPSPEERKRNAAIDSANRLILYRLQDRARLLRDSLRADSLRRDSIAKRIRP